MGLSHAITWLCERPRGDFTVGAEARGHPARRRSFTPYAALGATALSLPERDRHPLKQAGGAHVTTDAHCHDIASCLVPRPFQTHHAETRCE